MNRKFFKNKNILMITNHGVHEWKISPGLIDTGGQNLFVNQFTDTLADMEFKVTISNRGGYPHPITGKIQSGINYRDANRRIFYITDSQNEFIRKEDMHEQIGQLGKALADRLSAYEQLPDLIISHYWDGAAVAIRAQDILKTAIPHIWVPHSLGEIKRRKTTDDENTVLRMAERIDAEHRILARLDTVISTSEAVKQSLRQDYKYTGKIFFIPPCIDDNRYFPFKVDREHPVYSTLSSGIAERCSGVFPENRIITEVSRTDRTKRKDILINAFVGIMDEFPDVILAVTIDRNTEVGKELINLIDTVGAAGRISVLGSISDILPALYNISDIYCSPSVMEGFGMSVQEAASCKTAVIASELIPFAVEYLDSSADSGDKSGALIVKEDDIEGFSKAMRILLADKMLRSEIAENAYNLTIPYFTWPRTISNFLSDLEPGNNEGAGCGDL